MVGILEKLYFFSVKSDMQDTVSRIQLELGKLKGEMDLAKASEDKAIAELESLDEKREATSKAISELLDNKELTAKTLLNLQSKLAAVAKSQNKAMTSSVSKRKDWVESRVETNADGSKTFDTRHMTDSVKKYLKSKFDLPLCADIFSCVVEQYIPLTDKINKRSAAVALNSNQFASLFSMSHQGPNSKSDHFLSWVENKDLKRSDVMNWVVEHVFSNKPSEYKVGVHDVTRTASKPEYKIASLLYAFVEKVRENKDENVSCLDCLNKLISDSEKGKGLSQRLKSQNFKKALRAVSPKCADVLSKYEKLSENLHSDAGVRRQAIQSSLNGGQVSSLLTVLDRDPVVSQTTIDSHFELKGLLGMDAQAAKRATEASQRESMLASGMESQAVDACYKYGVLRDDEEISDLFARDAAARKEARKVTVAGMAAKAKAKAKAEVEAAEMADDGLTLGVLLADGLVGYGYKAPVSCMESCDDTIKQIQKEYMDNSEGYVQLHSLHASINDSQVWLNSNAQQDETEANKIENELRLARVVCKSQEVLDGQAAGLEDSDVDEQKHAKALSDNSRGNATCQEERCLVVVTKDLYTEKRENRAARIENKEAELKTAKENLNRDRMARQKIKAELLQNAYVNLIYNSLQTNCFKSSMIEAENCIATYNKARGVGMLSWFVFSCARTFNDCKNYIPGAEKSWVYDHRQNAKMQQLQEYIKNVNGVKNISKKEIKKKLDNNQLGFLNDCPVKDRGKGITGTDVLSVGLWSAFMSGGRDIKKDKRNMNGGGVIGTIWAALAATTSGVFGNSSKQASGDRQASRREPKFPENKRHTEYTALKYKGVLARSGFESAKKDYETGVKLAAACA